MEVQEKEIQEKTGKPWGRPKPKSLLEHVEIFINTSTHALIGITTFYITWYAFTVGFEEYQTYHAWFTTIAYQFFMSEGILALYNKNTFTMLIQSRVYKIRIHWVLQSTAAIMAIYGMTMIIYNREITNRPHFHNTHGITGLTSGIFLILTILSGCSALFSTELKRFIKPLLSKTVHNVLSCACYVSGMIAIISAYVTRSWLVKADPGEVRHIMIYLLSFILAFTMIGPLKTLFVQLGLRKRIR